MNVTRHTTKFIPRFNFKWWRTKNLMRRQMTFISPHHRRRAPFKVEMIKSRLE